MDVGTTTIFLWFGCKSPSSIKRSTQRENHLSATALQAPHSHTQRNGHFYKIIYFIIKLIPETGPNHILKAPISLPLERDPRVKSSYTAD